MCTRSAISDFWKKKSDQSKRGLIPSKRIHNKEELQRTLSVLGFSYICSLFLVANDKSILHHDNIQKQKFQNFLKISSNNIFSDSHSPESVIFNFSLY